MTPVFKAIPAILLYMPLAAQSREIELRVYLQNASAYLLHVGESDDTLYKGLQALLRSDGLSEIVIAFGSVQTASPDYANFAKELGLARDSTWALTDGEGRCILQGGKLPGAEEIRNALDAAGVKSQIRALRNFLKQYPNHLDARRRLLEQLRPIAENRTQRALQLDLDNERHSALNFMKDPAATYHWLSNSGFIDTSSLDGKRLGPEQDIVIWGPYAQELQTLFVNGDWRPNIHWLKTCIPFELCSPTMIQIYKRHLAKVEARLEECPSNDYLWQYYAWMLSITKQNPAKALIDRLPLLPYQFWPINQALHLLISEERAKDNWWAIAEILMSDYPVFLVVYNFNETIKLEESESLVSSDPLYPEFAKAFAKGALEVVWRDYINPLLESLIKTNRVAEAEKIVVDTARFSAFRDVQRRAAELALNCGWGDLQAKWLALKIPEKPDEPDMYDLETSFYSVNTSPRLVLINAENADKQQIDAMLRQGRLTDWFLSRADLDPGLPELMRQKEGWPDGVAYWALFDAKNNVIAHGPGLPTEGALCQILEQSGIETQTSAYRRFIKEHPSRIDAKEAFLRVLKRIAEQKTKEGLDEGAGVNTALLLNEEDDRAIWGEYAPLYRQLLPYYLEQCKLTMDWYRYNPFDSEYFIHSQTMRNLAPALLPQVEDSLMRQPKDDDFLWGVWSALSDLVEPWRFTDLKENLVLQPYAYDPTNIPSYSARWSLLERYSARSNWQRVIAIQEWRWEAMRANLELDPTSMEEFLWRREMKHLLEAYLRLEKNNEANELVRIISQSPEWLIIKQSAVELAEKCGRGALAERWKSLN